MDVYAPFVDIYEEWAAPMTEDIPFYVELAREADGPVVELAVGSGRVAVPVARALSEQAGGTSRFPRTPSTGPPSADRPLPGRRVIGIDRSPGMLAKAREAATAAGVDLELREGDMRELALEEPAALIYCPYRSLLHLPTWADRRRVFERVVAALRPGGRFAWNAFVFDPHIAVRMDGVARPHVDSETLWEYAAHHPEDNRIDITAYVGEPGQEPRNLQLWWLTRSEWEGLIDVAGLEVEALYGWFDKSPFDDESREFVWVTRRPS